MEDKTSKTDKKKIIIFVTSMIVTVVICTFGGIFLSKYLWPYFSGKDSSDINTSTTNTQPRTWEEKIVLDIPSDTVGGTKEVDLTGCVPCYDDCFKENLTFSKDETNPYLFVISMPNETTDNIASYQENIKKYFSRSEPIPYVASITNVTTPINAQGYYTPALGCVITPFHYENVDYIYVQYVPFSGGMNYQLASRYEHSYLVPGLEMINEPTYPDEISEVLEIEYEATEEAFNLWKQTLTYFGFEYSDGIYTHKIANELTIDISTPNKLVITDSLTK